MRACRAEAIELNDGSGSFAVEIAAMFYALSANELRVGDAFRQLPGMFVWYSVEGSPFDLDDEDVALLPDLQDEIASGKPWPEVRLWFEQRLKKV